MGIQSLVVYIGIVAALGVGILLGTSGASPRAAGFAVLGFVVVMWAVTHLIERLIRRGIWHYSAPYPYRSMQGETPEAKPAATAKDEGEELRDWRSSLDAAA
ncbi:MAG TPA: hypothetical protein VJP86_02770 [Vicinamibacterales bacterium]|jgi:hypothetical protein|nr:hypothetical protein [Vicinamibacterales bacterium]